MGLAVACDIDFPGETPGQARIDGSGPASLAAEDDDRRNLRVRIRRYGPCRSCRCHGDRGATVAGRLRRSPFPAALLALQADSISKSRSLRAELSGAIAMGVNRTAIALADGWAYAGCIRAVARAHRRVASPRSVWSGPRYDRVHERHAGERLGSMPFVRPLVWGPCSACRNRYRAMAVGGGDRGNRAACVCIAASTTGASSRCGLDADGNRARGGVAHRCRAYGRVVGIGTRIPGRRGQPNQCTRHQVRR